MRKSSTSWNTLVAKETGIRCVIDTDGFRPNVGIIVANATGQVLWARRAGQDAWQFPQGGIKAHESVEEALYRELCEELGLLPYHVEIVGSTRGWLRYKLPKKYMRRRNSPTCIGQKQVWYLLRLVSSEAAVKLDASDTPEFDLWKWVSYWRPVREVIYFKRPVYRRALKELAPLLEATLCTKISAGAGSQTPGRSEPRG